MSIPDANNHCVFHHFPVLCSQFFFLSFISPCLYPFIPISLHAYVRPSMPPCECLLASIPLFLHAFVPSRVHACVRPCLRASILPCTSMPRGVRASVPLSIRPFIPASIYPLVLHPIACIRPWFLAVMFLQDHFWEGQQLKRTLSESMLLPVGFGEPKVRCICKCLQRKKWSLGRWSLAGFHLISLSSCSTPPRRLTSNERCQTLWSIWPRTSIPFYLKVCCRNLAKVAIVVEISPLKHSYRILISHISAAMQIAGDLLERKGERVLSDIAHTYITYIHYFIYPRSLEYLMQLISPSI